MRFKKPCSRLRGMRFGWYVRLGTERGSLDQAASRDELAKSAASRESEARRTNWPRVYQWAPTAVDV
jgi:hypothetical protein